MSGFTAHQSPGTPAVTWWHTPQMRGECWLGAWLCSGDPGGQSATPVCRLPGGGQTQLLSRKPLESKAGLRVLRLAFYLAVTFLRFFIILNKSPHISTLPCPQKLRGRARWAGACCQAGWLPPGFSTPSTTHHPELSVPSLCWRRTWLFTFPAIRAPLSLVSLRGSAAVTSDRQ